MSTNPPVMDRDTRLAPFRGRPWSTQLAADIAAVAHAGAVDQVGVPYIEHPAMVARLCAPFGESVVQIGWLHDVVEDTDWTLEDLAELGAPDDVLGGVDAVTKVPGSGESRAEAVHRAAAHPLGRIAKAADNAHNGHPARNALIADPRRRARMARNYASDRAILDQYGAPRFTLP